MHADGAASASSVTVAMALVSPAVFEIDLEHRA